MSLANRSLPKTRALVRYTANPAQIVIIQMSPEQFPAASPSL